MKEENESPLEQKKERLYKNSPLPVNTAPELHRKDILVPGLWTADTLEPTHAKMSWSVRFFIGTLIFFVLAGGVSAVILLGGIRAVSTDRIDIEISGDGAISSGEAVNLGVRIINNNPTTIREARLIVDFPEGSREASDVTKALEHIVIELGDIPAGVSMEKVVPAVLFGSQGQKLQIAISLEYKTEGSNALSVKKSDHGVTVTTSPVTLTVTSVSEVASGQAFTLLVSVRSNSSVVLPNVAVLAQFPPGFVVSSAEPKADGSFFTLGNLLPGQEKRIKVTGALTGVANDPKAFRFTAGIPAEDGTRTLSLPYASGETELAIGKIFLETTLSINQNTEDPNIVNAGESISGVLSWRNMLSVPVTNAEITIAFSGQGLQPGSISTQNGFYRSSDSTLIFSGGTNSGLFSLDEGDTGSATFTFRTKTQAELLQTRNPTIDLLITIKGTRQGNSGRVETVTTTSKRKVQIASNITLVGDVFTSIGPFSNSGPIPPTPNVESTYTLMLAVANSLNAIGGARVTAELPEYVRFTGQTSTKTGVISYDASSRKISWLIGDISAGASTEGAFQVAILPSTSQSGTSPRVLSVQTFTGTDKFTGKVTETVSPALTTETPNEVGYTAEMGIVVK